MATIIGTAGWSIPRAVADCFAADGSSLQRYAGRFTGVEINSSFHRPHRLSTWQRWADSVPDGFRFAAKLPKTITHKRKLVDCGDLLDRFLSEAGGLGDKLAILLVQLPPKLAFDQLVASAFLDEFQPRTAARIVCEPRHASWFTRESDAFLASREIARVAADPAVVPAAADPGGWRGLVYRRLHGSPAIYRSNYEPKRLARYASLIRSEMEGGRPNWCIFDNTASSAATGNALDLMGCLIATTSRRPDFRDRNG